mgnify:CR=1 FL=1
MAEGKVRKVAFDAVEVVAAGFPIAGSLAVLSDKIRSGQALAEMDAKIDVLAAAVTYWASPERLEELVNDPEFVGAFLKAGTAARTAKTQERIEWLRNGLVNGYVRDAFAEDRETFMGVIERYTPRHVEILKSHEGRPFGYPVSDISFRLGPDEHRDRAIRQHLIADGFLSETTTIKDDRMSRMTGGRPKTEMQTKRNMTGMGRAFLEFIEDPDAPVDATAEPDSP